MQSHRFRAETWGWPGTFALKAATVAIVVVAAAEWGVRTYAATTVPGIIGMDAAFYVGRASSWLAGTGFYLPWQLTGQPYIVETGAVTYPPSILPLLVPFALGLPMVLWWAIPMGIFAASLWRLRPAVWTWPILALALIYPRTWVIVALGNPSMWTLAALAAGLAWGWPSVLVLLKPTFAPLALIGIRRRSWRGALAMLVAVSLPFGAMWLDYATAMLHATTNRGFEYLLGEWPIALALLSTQVPRRSSPNSGQ